MKITEEVYSLDSTRGNYAYAVLGSTVMLVDTGRPGQGPGILRDLRALGVQPGDVRHILLTHHDVDHIGSAAFLQRETGAQVWASHTDIPYILGEKPRYGIKRIVGALMRTPAPAGLKSYPESGEVEGVRVIPTPGHTPGHVCLLYQDVLFAGDLVMSMGGPLGLSRPLMTWDMDAVRESARKVGEYDFRWICPAHGQPTERGDVWEKLA
jgi:glyoxylase-like metal-dependent hydrolase (beta-lactamase superfamily II)